MKRYQSLLGLSFLSLSMMACEPNAPAEQTSQTEAVPAPVASISDGNITAERVLDADAEPGSWLAHGRTYGEQRYSPLNKIGKHNVNDLGLAWSFDVEEQKGLEASPIVVDGVMYTTTSWSAVYALDAKTGKQLWHYDPKVPKEYLRYLCCSPANRGVAVWKGKVYVGTINGHLVALDAKTGEVVWDVETTPGAPYSITGAPRVIKDKVIIGNGGAEMGVRGFITAYDVETGEQQWRFYTVPGNPANGFENPALEMAAKTWSGQWWKLGGGGTAWDSMAYDPELDLLYVGVGNGSPWNRNIRSPEGGDNLFLSSIVAVRPDTGEYVWHYQTTPADNFDYTATQHMILADIEMDGLKRKVIMQAPKNGFFYVLDRTNGEFLSAKPYVQVTWATHVDQETGRPVEDKSVTEFTERTQMVWPAPYGGHNWHPMAFNPNTGLVYIPAIEVPHFFNGRKEMDKKRIWNVGMNWVKPEETAETVLMNKKLTSGKMIAWDPAKQKAAWEVTYPTPGIGGMLTTAGDLVFHGVPQGKLMAYDASSGQQLWESYTQTGVVAPPISYEIDGEQYIAVMAGWGGMFSLTGGTVFGKDEGPGPNRVLVYKLGGKHQLPAAKALIKEAPKPPAQTGTPEQIAQGGALYDEFCQFCHGLHAVSGGVIPDLRHMDEQTHQSFIGIVYGGMLKDKGMAAFNDHLNVEEVQALHAYVIQRAIDTYGDERLF
ncbi:MAG: PQQ-dependent dehydrogenase, methanol/ethanol family [Cellvibrionaceae bacterium]|nr:PQQ-dependent dehydrogenase, methanol/ethanol family [Cellvibrionaceae bacterium]